MPSPLPGMDPWLESPAVFPDLHSTFVGYLREALNAVLPAPFYAALSTRVWMEDSERLTEPDVDVLRPDTGTPAPGNGTAPAAGWATGLLEIEAPLPDEEITERFIEIFAEPGGERLVASVELLSPSNKRPGSGGRDLFRAKQQEMVQAGVHLVKIDLLRNGTHTTLVPLGVLRQHAGTYDYHVCVHRADRPRSYFVAPLRLGVRLPTIPVPLTGEAAPASVDLQAVLDRSYDTGLYARRVRYDRPCDPPLTDDQRAWAEGVLREKGLC